MSILFATKPVVDAGEFLALCRDRNFPVERWYRKANHFRVPTGEGPGTGALLMRRSDFLTINTGKANELVFSSGSGRIPFPAIEVVRFENALPGPDDDGDTILVVHLADRRATFLSRVAKAFNVVNTDGVGYIAASLNGGVAYTWSEVFAYLWGQVNGAGTAPALPFTPHGTPENLAYWQTNAWTAVNDFLNRIGCTVLYRPDTNVFTVVRLGIDGTIDVAKAGGLRAKLSYQSEADVIDRAAKPETIRVLFRKPLDEITDLSVDPYYANNVTVSPAPTGVVTGSIVVLYDDLTGTAANSATRAARAAERAADWIRIFDNHDFHEDYLFTFAGFNVNAFTYLGSQGRELAFYDLGAGSLSEVSAGRFPVWKTPTLGDSAGGAGGSGDGVSVDTVHVVAQTGLTMTCRRVSLGAGGSWPPVESSPVVEYTGVFESENRLARIVDGPGTVSHILNMYRDEHGNNVVCFWKTCTFSDRTRLDDLNITSIVQRPSPDCGFDVTYVKTYITERFFIDVMPPGNPDSGIRHRIGTVASLPDVCTSSFTASLFTGTARDVPAGVLAAWDASSEMPYRKNQRGGAN